MAWQARAAQRADPVVTLVALQLPALFGGAIVTDRSSAFRIGSCWSTPSANDTPVIMGVTFVFSILVIGFNSSPTCSMAGSIRASPCADAGAPRRAAAPSTSPWAEAWRRFRRHRMALASLVVLTAMVLAVAFGPLLWPLAINEIDFTARLVTPSLAHPMGTDDLGQDVLARVLYGGRISLAVGLAAMAMAIVVGVLVGALAGISRGPVDAALCGSLTCS